MTADPATAPLPAKSTSGEWGTPAGDDTWGEAICEAWTAWSDEHELGRVAETHNHLPIPDDQHDANSRLIAQAPAWLDGLCGEVETLRSWLDQAVEMLAAGHPYDPMPLFVAYVQYQGISHVEED